MKSILSVQKMNDMEMNNYRLSNNRMNDMEIKEFFYFLDEAIVTGDYDAFNEAIFLFDQYDNYYLDDDVLLPLLDVVLALYYNNQPYYKAMSDMLNTFLIRNVDPELIVYPLKDKIDQFYSSNEKDIKKGNELIRYFSKYL